MAIKDNILKYYFFVLTELRMQPNFFLIFFLETHHYGCAFKNLKMKNENHNSIKLKNKVESDILRHFGIGIIKEEL